MIGVVHNGVSGKKYVVCKVTLFKVNIPNQSCVLFRAGKVHESTKWAVVAAKDTPGLYFVLFGKKLGYFFPKS